jgi:AcrR family transcriptional regulator
MTESNSRVEKKKQTREKIISAVISVISEEGITDSLVKSVSKTAEVSHGSIFAHFGSKESMLAEAVQNYKIKIWKYLLPEKNSNQLSDALDAHLKLIVENENLYTNLILKTSILPEKARMVVLQLQMEISSYLMTAISAGVSSNIIRELDPILAVNMWLGLVNHYLQNAELFSPGESTIKKHGETLKKFFVDSIKMEEK